MDFPRAWKAFWNKWDIRVFMLCSFFLQIILILFGNQRHRVSSKLVTFVLWSSYLLSDWVATFALGVLTNDQDDQDPNSYLLAFWSPFLLLHLGGSDSVTAFSLDDNSLWMRHFVAFSFHVGLAIYVFLRSVPGTSLYLPGTFMFIAGILKYGERTWALMLSSQDHLKSSLLPPPDPGPGYARFIDNYNSMSVCSLQPRIVIQTAHNESELYCLNLQDNENERIDYRMILWKAFSFSKTFTRLVVDYVVDSRVQNESRLFFLKLSAAQAFKIVEVELFFIYEMLYTKGAVIHTAVGPLLRAISSISVAASFALFNLVKKERFDYIDTWITWVLLTGALALELYWMCSLAVSDWAFLKLRNTKFSNAIFALIATLRPEDRPRWSSSTAELNLITSCLRDSITPPSRSKRFILNHYPLNYLHSVFQRIERTPISEELMKLIFEQLKLKSKHAGSSEVNVEMGRGMCRGELSLDWSIALGFDQRVLLWHIATDLCYNASTCCSDHHIAARRTSMLLSDYMLYILLLRCSGLSSGIGQVRYRDTCAEARSFFEQRQGDGSAREARKKLLMVDTTVSPRDVKGGESRSVLFDACRLAKDLLKLKGKRRWEVVSEVWVDMLCCAARSCGGYRHAEMLSSGGELVSMVWLMMAHLGVGEWCGDETKHVRARIVVDQ